MKYCIVCVITASDTANQVRDLLGLGAGQTGLKDYVKGLNPDPDTGDFQDYVLSFGGTTVTVTGPKGTPVNVPLFYFFAYNGDVNQQVVNRIGTILNNNPGAGSSINFSPALTRAEIVARLKLEVGSNIGADHYWATQPGDDVTTGVTDAASLLAKFAPVPA